jgi:alcohol dehydrogenase (cytochrome c)
MVMRVSSVLVSATLLIALGSRGSAQRAQPGAPPDPASATDAPVPEKLRSFVPVTDDMLMKPKPENWLSFRNGPRLWGYSPLNQINAGNVGQLRLVWSRAMQDGPQEVEPIVYDGIMYLTHAEDIVQAVDATNGDMLWEYRRRLPPDVARITGTMFRYRNVALWQDKIYLATNDAYLVALDAKTGRVVWETKRGEFKDKVSQTAGPIIVKGKAIIGTRCDPSSPLPGGCFVTAYDARHGEELWRVNTAAKPGEPGGDTWGKLTGDERRHASAWMVPSYDADLNLVYWGTGVTALRPDTLQGVPNADLLYTNSTLAVNPDTGKMSWYYQHLPRDYRDLDHPFERMIVDTIVAPSADEVPWINPRLKSGEKRKVVTGVFGKTGIVWSIDAKTGEFLWARPSTFQNVMKGIDPNTGKPIVSDLSDPKEVPPNPSCPHLYGGKNQPSGAFSPDTGAMYFPLNNACSGGIGTWGGDRTQTPPQPVQSLRLADGMAVTGRMVLPPGSDPARSPVGRLEAISVSTGKTLWKYEQRPPIYGSLLTTGGNLVFSGDIVRRFRAFNAQTGSIVWETILNGPVTARPMTYSVGGRQYLAIGAGGSTQGTAFLALTPELTTTRGSNTLFVFALPEQGR